MAAQKDVVDIDAVLAKRCVEDNGREPWVLSSIPRLQQQRAGCPSKALHS